MMPWILNCTPFFLSSLQTSRKMDPKKRNPKKKTPWKKMETADGNLACKWQNDKFWAWKNPRIPNPRTNVRKEAMNHNNAAGHMLLLHSILLLCSATPNSPPPCNRNHQHQYVHFNHKHWTQSMFRTLASLVYRLQPSSSSGLPRKSV